MNLDRLLGDWYDPLEELHDRMNELRGHMSSQLHTPKAFLDCFRRTKYEDCHVVFMGIAPYHECTFSGISKATGVALEQNIDHFKFSPTLKEFYYEMNRTYDDIEEDHNLSYLCEQGVLFINSSLTTVPGLPGTPSPGNPHLREWKYFTSSFVRILSTSKPVIFVFMGKNTHEFSKYVYTTFYGSTYINTYYPISYNKEGEEHSKFIGSNVFVKVNRYLSWMNLKPIIWSKKRWNQTKIEIETKTKEMEVSGKET